MSKKPFWRRVVATSAAAALSLGGALLVAAPAQAALGTLAIVSPADGSTVESRAFDITGTGTAGAGIGAETADGTVLGAAIVETSGGWTLPVTFAPEAEVAQEITIVQVDPDNPLDPEPDTIVLDVVLPEEPVVPPAPAPAGEIVITSPTDGATTESRIVLVTGTAPVGSAVSTALNGAFSSQIVGPRGDWRFYIPFGIDDPGTATITVTGTDADGADLLPGEVTITVPSMLPAPTIESPSDGAVVQGDTVVFSGTGTPNTSVSPNFEATDEATQRAVDEALFEGDLPYEPVGASVAADGTWSIEWPLPAGSYVVSAAHVEFAGFALEVSPPSEEHSFSVVSAAAVDPAGSGAPTLAATGAAAEGGVELGVGLLLVGGLLLLLNMRLRRQGVASADAVRPL
ncbi:Ig-like domain-containing protein [Marisediminicola sp. LYQ134]|uniref:Ig-like domain-containing protein n=1 Tax=Marisediminicola sp. LYQ134 TaxID=3391061 RepID=UPI003983A8E2